jgi:hypothetical protein
MNPLRGMYRCTVFLESGYEIRQSVFELVSLKYREPIAIESTDWSLGDHRC